VTVDDGVGDLHALLAAGGVEPPYVLLGWSIGAWYARVFTHRYPGEVAGVVLLDGTHPDEMARLTAALPPARADEDPQIAKVRELIAAISTMAPSAETGWFDFAASAEQVRASGDLGDRPVVVLTQGSPQLDWGVPGFDLPEPYASRLLTANLALQNELASLSTRGEQRTVDGAGHAIQYHDPDAVLQAITDVEAMIEED
jgi:pimeloyl-ACP methyl ester carboxylesterase